MPSDTFAARGFLSDFVYHHKNKVRDEYSQLFVECERRSDLSQAKLIEVTVSSSNVSLLSSYLFTERSIRSCQAAIRLCEIGLVQEAQVLVRTAYETLFHAAALLVRPDIFKRLESHEATEDAKQANAIKSTSPTDSLTEEQIGWLDEVIVNAEEHKNQQSAYESARIAGMLNVYATVYRGLSSLASHATLRSLDHAFAVEDGEYVLIMGPSENQLQFTMSLAGHCLELSLENLNKIQKT